MAFILQPHIHITHSSAASTFTSSLFYDTTTCRSNAFVLFHSDRRTWNSQPVTIPSAITASGNKKVLQASNASLNRRSLLKSFTFVGLTLFSTTVSSTVTRADLENPLNKKMPQLTTEDGWKIYKGAVSLGYSFEYPPDWNIVRKPIKTHISEVIASDPSTPSSYVGFVVDAVKINTVEEFGSPEVVGERVVALEKKKDGVTKAEILVASQNKVKNQTYYNLEYIVDSSRGVKHFLAKATVTGGNLYVMTAQAKEENYKASLDIFQRMLNSLNVITQYF